MKQDSFPSFFDKVPAIITYDPLSLALGSVNDGIIKFRYKQIVKIAGHSCPTVAGAYLMCYKALKALCPDTNPVRGKIKVEFKNDLEDGTTGVISNVISNITGATEKSGFKGLNGKYARHSLMSFNAPINNIVRFTRIDTNKSVELFYNPNVVPPSARLQELIKLVISENANDEEKKEFGTLWQQRVEEILIVNFENKKLMSVV